MKALFASAALLALCACASRPTTTADNEQTAYINCRTEPMTGTRLKSCPYDRLIHVIGSQTAQDDARKVQSISNSTGARSN